MSSGLKITDFLSRARDVVTTDAGAEVFDRLVKVFSQPIDPSYKKKLEDRLHREINEDDSNRAPPQETFNEKVKEFFSVGDVVSLLGVALLSFQSKLSKSSKGGLVDGAFKNLALAMTFLGSPIALFGRATGKRQEGALGKDLMGDYNLRQAQYKGFDIFTDYKPEEINNLINSAGKLSKTLDYEDHVNPEIHSRHLKDSSDDSKGNKAGGLFCGAPGTGKTAGVQLILGKWAEMMKGKGFEPVIVGLDLANFHKFLQETQRLKDSAIESINAFAGGEQKLFSSAKDNQGLTIFEVLISQIEKKSRAVAKHNKEHPENKQKLFFVVDEFDKVLVLKDLQGADRNRLKNAVLRLNQIFEDQNILLTSNTSLKQMVTQLKDIVGDEAVWKPFESRLNSNHVSVDEPSTRVQAKIFAGKILHDHYDAIDWQAFKIKPAKIFDLDKVLLADSINENILKPMESIYKGRELNSISLDIKPRLLDRALNERIQKKGLGISDQNWSAMSDMAKISTTNVKITPDLLKELLTTKHEIMKGKHDPNLGQAYSIVEAYADLMSKDKAFMEAVRGNKSDDILSLIATFYNKENGIAKDVYSAKSAVFIGDKIFNHKIIHEKADLHKSLAEDKLKIEFTEALIDPKNLSAANSLANIKFAPAKFTLDISPNKFSSYFTPKLNSILETPVDKTMNNIVGAFQTLLKGGEAGKGLPKGTEDLIKTAANRLVQAAMK
jgi:SpoVK/Ycf46/Vps4 family AAA+-type ATPase